MTNPRRSNLTLALVLALAAGTTALAQNALDKNLQTGPNATGINRPVGNFADQVRQRNALVTGNAAGGFSFRGDVGYRAAGDFRGNTGSGDTFAFRRDSLTSGLGGQGIRGTDALQYQFAYSTGQSTGGVANPLMVQRDTASRSITDINRGTAMNTTNFGAGARSAEGQLGGGRIDSRDLSLMSLRSPAAYSANRAFVPNVLATISGQDASGPVDAAMTASPLRGVLMERSPTRRADAKPAPRQGQLTDTAIASGEVRERVEQQIDTRNETRLNGLDVVRDRIAAAQGDGSATKTATPTEDTRPAWQVRLENVKKELAAAQEAEARRRSTEMADAPKAKEAEKESEKTGDKAGEKTAEKASAAVESRQSVLDMLRSAGGEPLQMLAPPGFDAYSEHMTKGQEYLSTGRYFDAEQRFVAALNAKPGDVMSAVGRVHSQLGAGTFVSASISLRQVFQQHPELIAVRYADKLLPTRQRFENASARLRDIIKEDPVNARDPGMLLSYLGHQFKDAAVVTEGLDAMDRSLAAKGVGGVAKEDDNLALARLLREIWTNPLLPGAGGANSGSSGSAPVPQAPVSQAPVSQAPAPQAPTPEAPAPK